MDADLGSNMVHCEVRIVSQSRILLPARSRDQIQHQVDELNEVLHRFGAEAQVVLLSRRHSIAVFFTCLTLSAVMNLRHLWCIGQLRDIVEKLFTFLAGATTTVHVRRLTWPVSDYERCWKFFSSLQGKPGIELTFYCLLLYAFALYKAISLHTCILS